MEAVQYEGLKYAPIETQQNLEIMDEYDEHGRVVSRRHVLSRDNKQGEEMKDYSDTPVQRVPPISLTPAEQDQRSEFTVPNVVSARISTEKVIQMQSKDGMA